MTSDEIIDMIVRHEGYSDRVYLDTVGIPTGGYGHAFVVGSYIPPHIAHQFLWLDVKNAMDDYEKLKLDLDPVRRAVVVNMLFNLGLTRFKRFEDLIAALRVHDYAAAKKEILDSKYAKQVKGRAVELAEMMLTGKLNKETKT